MAWHCVHKGQEPWGFGAHTLTSIRWAGGIAGTKKIGAGDGVNATGAVHETRVGPSGEEWHSSLAVSDAMEKAELALGFAGRTEELLRWVQAAYSEWRSIAG